ncbi:MAG: hypothetical protein KJO19_07910, partial [Woeseia sp.]|nr:hypothetical protein [Woeseia sp.]
MKNARETKTPRIVYAVDVPPLQLTALTEILARHAIGVRSFSGRARLAGVLKRGLVTPACILLACDLSARRDRAILGRLARASGSAPVVVLTRAVTGALQADAFRLGAADVVESSMMATYISLRILDVLGEHNELGGISVDPIVLADNANVVLRPFKPEDARHQSTFLKKLSLRGHSYDVLAANDERPDDESTATLFRNAKNGAAVVAVDTVRGKEKIIGIARARLTASGKAAGFAVAILKEWR